VPDEAEIHLLPDPVGAPAGPDGPVRSLQAAEIGLPLEYLERSWSPEYLERLARAYWAYLERISLRALRVLYGPQSRTVVLLTRRLPLLRFRAPRYETAPGLGQVTWPIERGVLVAPAGRGRGWLRISIRRVEDPTLPAGRALVHVAAEVANFYPGLRFSGPLSRLGAWIYNQTQARIHTIVTNGFLRSLARLDLPASRVGALSEPADRRPESG
jgi:hypothetical protein